MKIEELVELLNESIDSEVKALQSTHSIGYGAAGYGSVGIDNLKKLLDERGKLLIAACSDFKKPERQNDNE
jgi:hypothetical protein